MSNKINMNRGWILVKPETLNYHANDLRKVLEENGFFVEEKRSCNGFLEMSNEIYDKASAYSPMHKALNMYFFGDNANYCEVWFLKGGEDLDRIALFAKLGQIKKDFRTRHHIEGLKINVEYNGVESAFGFGFFHVPDPDDADIDMESRIIEKYFA